MTFEDEVVKTTVRTLGALLSTRSPSASQLPLVDTDDGVYHHRQLAGLCRNMQVEVDEWQRHVDKIQVIASTITDMARTH